MSLEETTAEPRTVADFAPKPLTRKQIARLCGAAQGITEPTERLRSAPSAGALYPLDLYLVTRDGVDQYQPKHHRLKRRLAGHHDTEHTDLGILLAHWGEGCP